MQQFQRDAILYIIFDLYELTIHFHHVKLIKIDFFEILH